MYLDLGEEALCGKQCAVSQECTPLSAARSSWSQARIWPAFGGAGSWSSGGQAAYPFIQVFMQCIVW